MNYGRWLRVLIKITELPLHKIAKFFEMDEEAHSQSLKKFKMWIIFQGEKKSKMSLDTVMIVYGEI